MKIQNQLKANLILKIWLKWEHAGSVIKVDLTMIISMVMVLLSFPMVKFILVYGPIMLFMAKEISQVKMAIKSMEFGNKTD